MVTLDDALSRLVQGRALGTLRLPGLRILTLWVRNKLTQHPDDPEWLELDEALRLVTAHRRRHPLPLPPTCPFGAPAVTADPSPALETDDAHP
jgi:hypothetical protein